MVVERIDSFFEWFKINPDRQKELELIAEEAALLSQEELHYKDYLALAAILDGMQPKRIFEIGTRRGITSDFFLQILPSCQLISIDSIKPKRGFLKKKNDTFELSAPEIGSYILPVRKGRFTQIMSNQKPVTAHALLSQYGKMDLVFINCDHMLKGIESDTTLAYQILSENGTICWSSANSQDKYYPVCQFLEQKMQTPMLATCDDYTGGIACWNLKIEQELISNPHVTSKS